MEYNDNIIVNDRQSRVIRQSFDNIHALELQDLIDIHRRMVSQKEAMERNNSDDKYRDAIAITNQNISSLEQILHNQHRIQSARYSLNGKYYSSSRILQTETDVYGKIPSHDEIMRMNPPLNTPNDIMPDTSRPENTPNNNINNNTNNNFGNNSGLFPNTGRPEINTPILPGNENNSNNAEVQPNTSPRRNSRVFPMQGSILSNLTQSLFMKKAKKQSIINDPTDKADNVSISSYTPRDIRDYFPYKRYGHETLDKDYCDCKSIYPDRPPHNPYWQPFMSSRVNGGGGHPWHYINNCRDCDRDEDYNKHLKYIDYSNNIYNNYKYKSYDYYEQDYEHDNCDKGRKLVTGQIDILRLLILFISLRPRCAYLPSICKIADEQFGVLIQLID